MKNNKQIAFAELRI